jgi:hypothetical protein
MDSMVISNNKVTNKQGHKDQPDLRLNERSIEREKRAPTGTPAAAARKLATAGRQLKQRKKKSVASRTPLAERRTCATFFNNHDSFDLGCQSTKP